MIKYLRRTVLNYFGADQLGDSSENESESDSDNDSDDGLNDDKLMKLFADEPTGFGNSERNSHVNSVVDDHDKVNDECWDDEWNALAHDLKKYHRLNHIDYDHSQFYSGIITELDLEKKELILDQKIRCVYDRCTYGTPELKDVIKLIRMDNEMVLMPMRQKCYTGKVTAIEQDRKHFIFCNNSFISFSSVADRDICEGEIIKCLVIECKFFKFSWRAIPIQETGNNQIQVDDEDKMIEDLIENKFGIEIGDDLTFGRMKLGDSKRILVSIRNKGTSDQTLVKCCYDDGEVQIEVEGIQVMGKIFEFPYVIQPKSECLIALNANAKYLGTAPEKITFKFEGEKQFEILRFVQLQVDNKYLNHMNQSDKMKQRQTDFKQMRNDFGPGNRRFVVRGPLLWAPTKHIHEKLPPYKVPKAIWEAAQSGHDVSKKFDVLKQELSVSNYKDKFTYLIYLEELEQQMNLWKNYSLSNVVMEKENDFFSIEVPGLAEGRPSLVMGDKIIVQMSNGSDQLEIVCFEGVINDIRKEDILVKFALQFHEEYKSEPVNIRVQMNRTLIRRSHFVLQFADYIKQILFPEKIVYKKPLIKIPNIESLNWFNQDLNARQKLAVAAVIKSECRPAPYIIFGPPGTGKTVTVVECILQIFTLIPNSRILACCVSNNAADLIARKLLESKKVNENDLIRISAFYRMNYILEDIKSITKAAVEDSSSWLYKRIIVTTTCQSGVIYRHKVSPDHFTHCFIDEAAQVTEPESLIAITLVALRQGAVILAGDHMQLGPVILSPHAKKYEFGISLMERLMSTEPYKRDSAMEKFGNYNPKCITKLIINYRTDERIMKIPSELFYNSELKYQIKCDEELLKKMNLKFPVVFHGTTGKDEQSDDSPSWFNQSEILNIAIYLCRLRKAGVKTDEIGIITPYRKQVEMIRRHLRYEQMPDCKVSTIEEFQGDEKKVIIVSMVRSSSRHLSHDMKYNLGFVFNSKRFNVILSRAMSLLIVIGDPDVLSEDSDWQKFVIYCHSNNAFVGNVTRNFEHNKIDGNKQIKLHKVFRIP